jgi:hypothetical protein
MLSHLDLIATPPVVLLLTGPLHKPQKANERELENSKSSDQNEKTPEPASSKANRMKGLLLFKGHP